MRSRMTERGRRVLAVLLVGSLLAMFAGALPVAADYGVDPQRAFSNDVVEPGETFEVTVTFAAPVDDFNAIGMTDAAPEGWLVTVDPAWNTPFGSANTLDPNEADFMWYETYDEDQPFQVMYEVLVPAEATPGTYYFDGDIEYHVSTDGPYFEDIGGQQTVTIPPAASHEVGLSARTPAEKGSIQLIKLFEPVYAEFPYSEIEVQITGDDFDRTYLLTHALGWEKIIDDIPVGTYTVEELTAVPGWAVSYNPGNRLLEVEAGETATMTITNIYLVGSIELVKLFDPGDTEYPHDQIDVQVTGPHDFNETYTLRRGEGWEKTIDDVPVGTYTVEELSFVFGWIPTYDPDSRDLEVEVGAVATMTITNTYSVLGFSVSPSEIDFEEITPGATQSGDPITVNNTGSVAIDVRAELDEDTVYNDAGDHFYTAALRLAGEAASGMTGDDLGTWTAGDLGLADIAPGGAPVVTTAVECPAEMYPDTEYTGKLLFIASASD